MKIRFQATHLCLLRSLAVLFLLLLPLQSPAQNPRGTLRGTIEDPSGAAVPLAKIVVHATDSSLQRETTSDNRGEFSLEDLLPGTYHVVVSAKGFAEATSDVKVVVSSVREVLVRLKLQPLEQQTVTLDGEPVTFTTQPIDTSSAVHQTII